VLRSEQGTGVDVDYGYFVKLLLTDGHTILMAHLHEQSPLVQGQKNLGPDTFVGYMGSTGRSSGIHLHFEIYYMAHALANSIKLFGYDSASWIASENTNVATFVPANTNTEPPTPPTPPTPPPADVAVSLHDNNNGGGKTVQIGKNQLPLVLSDIRSVFDNDSLGSITKFEKYDRGNRYCYYSKWCNGNSYSAFLKDH
jgi:hypothetical protein